MIRTSIADLLSEWRAAERRWEQADPSADLETRAMDVIHAWLAYQNAVLADGTGEFMLVADDTGTYVAATEGVTAALGYQPGDLTGKAVSDLAAPDLAPSTNEQWYAFLARGREEGRYRLRAQDGGIVEFRYQARAHHPLPGFHLSRLWFDR